MTEIECDQTRSSHRGLFSSFEEKTDIRVRKAMVVVVENVEMVGVIYCKSWLKMSRGGSGPTL